MSTIKSNNILKDLTDILNYSDLIYSKDCSDYFKEVTADTLEKFENLFYDKITNQIKSEQFTLYFEKLIDFIDDIDYYIGYEAILNCTSLSHSVETITYDNMFILRDKAIEIHRVLSNEYSDRIEKQLLDQAISSPPFKIDHETFLKYSRQFEKASNNGDESIQLGEYNINVKDHGNNAEVAKMLEKVTEEVRGGPFDPDNGKEPIANLIGRIIHYRITNPKNNQLKRLLIKADKFIKKEICSNKTNKTTNELEILAFLIITEIHPEEVNQYITKYHSNNTKFLNRLLSSITNLQLVEIYKEYSIRNIKVIVETSKPDSIQLIKEQISKLDLITPLDKSKNNHSEIQKEMTWLSSIGQFISVFTPIIYNDLIAINEESDAKLIIKELLIHFNVSFDGKRVLQINHECFTLKKKFSITEDVIFQDESRKIKTSLNKFTWKGSSLEFIKSFYKPISNRSIGYEELNNRKKTLTIFCSRFNVTYIKKQQEVFYKTISLVGQFEEYMNKNTQ